MKIYAFADEASPQLSGQIQALLENSLDGMEIRNVDGENVSALSPEKARIIRRRMDDAGLAVWSIGSPLGKADITDDFYKQTEMLKRMLEIADILGAAHLRLFSFYTPETDRDAWRDVVLERLGTFTEIARGSGVMLCHENEKGIFGDTGRAAPSCITHCLRCTPCLTPPTLCSAGKMPPRHGNCCAHMCGICTSRMRCRTAAWCLPGAVRGTFPRFLQIMRRAAARL
ncbi:MAG: sugar phosphate isomerase/epimerase [Clostridiales bacterium]|nr:sugar phosphate isomerase/epimerase [Clostridiales bacterium]